MIRSNRNTFFALLFWTAFVVSADAQQSNPQQPPPPVNFNNFQVTRIAVIYTDAFYDPNNGVSRLVNAIKSLDQEFQSRKTELQRLQQRIEQLTGETTGSTLGGSPATVQVKLTELEQLKKDSQRKAEDAQADYTKRLREVMNPVFQDLDKAIAALAQQRGITLIMDGSKLDEALLYFSEGSDPTRAFITEFNRLNPSASADSPRTSNRRSSSASCGPCSLRGRPSSAAAGHHRSLSGGEGAAQARDN